MSKDIKELVVDVLDYEPLGKAFMLNALMNEANRAIKHYAENGHNSTTVGIIDPKIYSLVACSVKQQLESILDENK